MGLSAVYRIYASGGPPVTTWNKDATPVPTSGFKFTKRNGQASTANFEVPGASTLAKQDRIFAYGKTSIIGTTPVGGWGTGTTLTLSGYTVFPLLNLLILVEDELILVTSRSSGTLTCTRAYGGTSLDSHPEAEPVYLMWTWGGIVHTRTKTKGGSQFECLDFLDALEGITVAAEYPGAGTNDTDVEILTEVLTLQKTPLPLQLVSTGVTPTAFRKLVYEDKTIKNVIDQFCIYTGNKYTCYQSWWDVSPKLNYFDTTLGSSNISLAAGDFYSDWSIEESRASLANKVKITTNLTDVPTEDVWCLDTDTADLFGMHNQGIYDYEIGMAADKRAGFHFTNGKFTSKIKNISVRAKKVGTSTSHLYAKTTINAGTDEYLTQIATAAELSTSYGWVTVATAGNPDIPPFADVYIELITYDNSDTNYFKISNAGNWNDNRVKMLTNSAASIWDAGAVEITTGGIALSFQIGTVALANWSVTDATETRVGYDSDARALFVTGCPTSATGEFWKVPVTPPIAHHEYGYLKFEMMGSGAAVVVCLGKEAAMTNYYWSNASIPITIPTADEWTEISMPIGSTASGFPGGWTAVNSPDWDTIAELAFYILGGAGFVGSAMKIRNLRFEGSAYSKTSEDANSQASYEVKAYPEDVPFQTIAEVDAYAAALLAARKDPQSSISIRSKYLYPVELFYYVTVTLDGDALTPTVIGYDIDPIRGETKFIFNALSAHDFARWMYEIRIDPLTG